MNTHKERRGEESQWPKARASAVSRSSGGACVDDVRWKSIVPRLLLLSGITPHLFLSCHRGAKMAGDDDDDDDDMT